MKKSFLLPGLLLGIWGATAYAAVAYTPVEVTPDPADVDGTAKFLSSTPEWGSTIASLKDITVNFSGSASSWSASIKAGYAPDEWDETVPYRTLPVMRAGKEVARFTCLSARWDWGTESIVLSITLSEEMTYPGVYELTLPEGLVMDSMSADYANAVSGQKTLKFQVDGSLYEGDLEEEDPKPEEPEGFHLAGVTPDPLDMASELGVVTAKWIGADGTAAVWDGPEKLPVKSDQGWTVGYMLVDTAADGSIVFSAWPAEIAITGNFSFTIPAGSVRAGEDANEELTWKYALIPESSKKAESIYPISGANLDYNLGTTLNNINLTYSSNVTVNPAKKPYLLASDGSVVFADELKSFSLEPTVAIVKFEQAETLPTGQYILMVPAGAITGAQGEMAIYNYVAPPKKDIEEIPEGTPLEVKEAWVQSGLFQYNLLDADNGLAAIPGDSPIFFATNYDGACDVVWYTIVDVTGLPESKYSSAPGLYSTWIDGGKNGFRGVVLSPRDGDFKYLFYSDRQYAVRLVMYEDYYGPGRRQRVEGYTPLFTGATPPFQYADMTLKITPTPGSDLSYGDWIQFKFTEPVEADREYCGIPQGQEGKLYPEIKSNEDKTEWSFLLPEACFEFTGPESIEGHFAFNRISDGARVRPSEFEVPETEIHAAARNWGENETSKIILIYGSFQGNPSFTINPAPGEVNNLSFFDFTYGQDGEINPGWYGSAVVKNEEGVIVATLVCDAFAEFGGNIEAVTVPFDGNADDPMTVKLTMKLDRAITAAGEYTIYFPYGYFSIGRENNSKLTRPEEFSYVVDGLSSEVEDLILEDVNDGVVYNLHGVAVGLGEQSLENLPAGIYIIDGKKTIKQ